MVWDCGTMARSKFTQGGKRIMHDTHDVRKSKELHDKEMLLDRREPTPSDLTDEQVFRSELLKVLERIAKTLEYIENGIIHLNGEYWTDWRLLFSLSVTGTNRRGLPLAPATHPRRRRAFFSLPFLIAR
jgi:hypothetical protein